MLHQIFILGICHFNPRPPRGGRLSHTAGNSAVPRFQSTPPARGATRYGDHQQRHPRDFNPRPPRGGRRTSLSTLTGKTIISIHAPREGGDSRRVIFRPFSEIFQSTPPARGATPVVDAVDRLNEFQSTPPARGATSFPGEVYGTRYYFNPRPPRGGRPFGLSLGG